MIKKVYTREQWDNLDEQVQRDHLQGLADRIDLDLPDSFDVSQQLEEVCDEAAVAGEWAIHAWAEMILSRERCPRRRMLGRLESGTVHVRWLDCGTRSCEHCGYWLAYNLADRYARAWAEMVDSPSAVHVISVHGKHAAARLLQRINRHGEAALRIPVNKSDDVVVLTTLNLGSGRTLADEGDTLCDALFGLLLLVPAGTHVKPNQHLGQAAAAVQSAQGEAPESESTAEVVVFTPPMRRHLIKGHRVTERSTNGWTVDIDDECLAQLIDIRNEGVVVNPIPRKKAI